MLDGIRCNTIARVVDINALSHEESRLEPHKGNNICLAAEVRNTPDNIPSMVMRHPEPPFIAQMKPSVLDNTRLIFLAKNLSYWFADSQHSQMVEKFAAIASDEDALPFIEFLHALKFIDKFSNGPAFKMQVIELLDEIVASSKLRKSIFSVTSEATTSCYDRVVLTWNDVQQAKLIHDIECGTYDKRIPELVIIARVMFRIIKLEQIAQAKIQKEPRLKSEALEVILGFQTKLKNTLSLIFVFPKMLNFSTSYITKKELKDAEIMVKTAENNEFAIWFAQWLPLHTALARSEPKLWADALEKREQIYENEYRHRCDHELASINLAGDQEAEKDIGIKVMNEINEKVFGSLCQTILARKKLELLLGPQWKMTATPRNGGVVRVLRYVSPLLCGLAGTEDSHK